MAETNPNWNHQDDRSKLMSLGVSGGDWRDMAAIIASRHARKPEIASRLSLCPDDRVLDLGSGMGFIAEVIAPEVAQLHCADVSEVYLSDCSQRIATLPNVAHHQIAYADLSAVYGKGITKAYATLLFIHFNFYDFVLYLRELHEVLEPGGLLYFDYNDGNRINLSDPDDSINHQIAIYKDNRERWIFGCMHMGSQSVLRNIAPQLGFRVLDNWSSSQCFSHMLLRRAA
jgi:cyclopropane fatty-acyl-phospholipid synthase-like methyltransferase